MENKATIIIATHKKYQMPADKMYLPVHVGAEGKKDSDGKDLVFSSDHVRMKEFLGKFHQGLA